MPAIPASDGITHLVLADLHRQQALGTECLFYLLVGNQGGGATEIAALANPAHIKHRDGLAALTPNRNLLRLPSTLLVWNATQCRRQIMFHDDLIAGGC